MIVIEYILGSLFRLAFFLVLLIFHPLQVLAYNILGKKAHQKVVHYMNGLFIASFRIAGTKITYTNNYDLPNDRPIILIANHQSLWDIVGIYWFMRELYPLFVSKIELAKGIPSISYNLRRSNSALIDRKDRKQAISEILKLGTLIDKEKRAAVIFPEGTRSRDGNIGQFAYGGISGLLKKAPNAIIIPIVIQGTGALAANKYYRIKSFKKISWTVLAPFDASDKDYKEVIELCYASIKAKLEEAKNLSSISSYNN